MKLQKLFLGFMLLGLFAACTNQDDLVSNVPENAEESNSFLAVNISSPTTTRASFEDGLDAEHAINNGIFFFFNPDGSSASEAQTPALTWEKNDASNITKTSNAVLVFDSSEGKTLPSSMIVILNPSLEVTALTTPSLQDLKDAVETSYLGEKLVEGEDQAPSGFMMSNSVYMSSTGLEMMPTPIGIADIFDKQEDAMKSPVDVYVERLAVKIVTTYAETMSNTGTETTVGSATVKITPEVVGWQIVNTNPKSKLLKDLSDVSNPFTGWNDATNYRSYWAKSYTPTAIESYGSLSYETINLKNEGIAYCFENTTSNSTKLIVTAVLKDASGVAQDIMKFAGKLYYKEGIQKLLASTSGLYTRTGESSTEYTYATIPFGDITFEAGSEQYSVVATLADGYGTTLYNSAGVEVSLPDARAKLNSYGNILYWNGGMTYYYVDIIHRAEIPAVIRNHVYKLNVTSIVGLGTPVPYPEVVIVPKVPVDEESYIAAQINILPWEIVTQNIQLGN